MRNYCELKNCWETEAGLANGRSSQQQHNNNKMNGKRKCEKNTHTVYRNTKIANIQKQNEQHKSTRQNYHKFKRMSSLEFGLLQCD